MSPQPIPPRPQYPDLTTEYQHSAGESKPFLMVSSNPDDERFFLRVTTLNPDAGFTCEYGADELDPVPACTEPAKYVVEVCDAPELIREPDAYRYCRDHTLPAVGAWYLTF